MLPNLVPNLVAIWSQIWCQIRNRETGVTAKGVSQIWDPESQIWDTPLAVYPFTSLPTVGGGVGVPGGQCRCLWWVVPLWGGPRVVSKSPWGGGGGGLWHHNPRDNSIDHP